MTTQKNIVRKIFIVLSGVLLAALIFASYNFENNTCMGVKIITEAEKERYTPSAQAEFATGFLFNGTPAAVDNVTKTIYISQDINEESRLTDFKGRLDTTNINLKLLFVENQNIENLAQSMAEGYRHTLLLINNTEYIEYGVVFTNLPVFNMGGVDAGVNETGWPVYQGQVSFWDSCSKETQDYKTLSLTAQWEVRGNTVAGKAKNPWKLSVKDSKGNNKNVSFCGLGEDDDWILNSMTMDDLRLREKLSMDIWQEIIADRENSHNMSTGEYVEVVINGEYKGLFLIQRRVDEKYLKLGDDDILIKGSKIYNPIDFAGMRLKYSPYDEETTKEIFAQYFDNNEYIKYINADNIADVNILMQFLAAVDNAKSKNIFIVLQDIEQDYNVDFILWDVDMCLGLTWDGTRFVYRPEKTLYQHCNRTETKHIAKENEDIYKIIAERWFELRKTVLSEDHVWEKINGYIDIMEKSGAYNRDSVMWGYIYGGADNIENLHIFIKERTAFLDEYYKSFM